MTTKTESITGRLDLLEHATRRHERMIGELRDLLAQQQENIDSLVHTSVSERSVADLRDRHEQLAARFRMLEERGES